MSVITYRNIYSRGAPGVEWYSPEVAGRVAVVSCRKFVRVEMLIRGRRFCPPVGMRSVTSEYLRALDLSRPVLTGPQVFCNLTKRWIAA